MFYPQVANHSLVERRRSKEMAKVNIEFEWEIAKWVIRTQRFYDCWDINVSDKGLQFKISYIAGVLNKCYSIEPINLGEGVVYYIITVPKYTHFNIISNGQAKISSKKD